MPSENWNSPASTISCTASAITLGSCVYNEAMKCGRPSISAAETSCVPRVKTDAAKARVAHTARVAPVPPRYRPAR